MPTLKSRKLNTAEQFKIYRYHILQPNNILNEQLHYKSHTLFDTLIQTHNLFRQKSSRICVYIMIKIVDFILLLPVSYKHLSNIFHDYSALYFSLKIIFEMEYYHRKYFFLLTASALTTVLWSLTYTTSHFRTRFSLMMAVDGTAETSGFAENIGPRPNSPGRNFNNKLLLCCR